MGTAPKTTPEEWDRVIGVNWRSVYLGMRQLYPLLRGGGAMVNEFCLSDVGFGDQ